jgi:hypothetical protein
MLFRDVCGQVMSGVRPLTESNFDSSVYCIEVRIWQILGGKNLRCELRLIGIIST